LSNTGLVYDKIAQPQKALEYYNSALSIAREVGDREQEATTLNNIGSVYDTIGQIQQALKYFNAALPIFRELGDRSGEASILNNIGLAYDNLKRPQEALESYNLALPIAKKVGDRSKEAIILNNIGLANDNIGEPLQALESYNRALAVYRKAGNSREEATTLSNIGAVYSAIGQTHEALEYYKQSLPIRKKVGDRIGEVATLSNIGAAYRNNNQPQEAIKNLEQAVKITLQLRGGLERTNRQAFLQSIRGTGVGLIDLLIAQNKPERAYQWVNLITTADLADYSRLIDAKVANPQAQSAIKSWNQSNRKLESLRQQLQNNFSPELSVQINTLQAQVNQQAETISRKFPEVAELFETKPTDIAQLRANIPTGTVVIQPVLLTGINDVADTIALFVLTKDKLTVTQQKIDPKVFDDLITQYRSEITDGRFNKYRATSKKLYDILIRPVESQIQAASTKQLSIIATGKLRYIPFETLIDSKTNKYLIEKYPVNNLTRLSGRPLPPNKLKSTLLGIGNPFPNDDRKLEGAEEEIKSVTPLLPGSEAHLGAEAKLDTFTTLAPRFPILHLATHGCFNPEGCPSLKLEANSILFSDRNFNIADAALLGLKNTDLVVLSACQTAVQANSNGEEFTGMAYLFERAGARSVIASLWLAKDEETKQLMIQFYQNLKKGMTKGEALRQAKLSLIDKHPLYWSPFILIGDAR
jgi:CHAT domain-containing protein/Tfp pilus assembly protein PilF